MKKNRVLVVALILSVFIFIAMEVSQGQPDDISAQAFVARHGSASHSHAISSADYPQVKVPAQDYAGSLEFIKVTGCQITQDTDNKTVTLSDGKGRLLLRLNYNGRSMIDDVRLRGSQNLVASVTGVCSAILTEGQWHTTRSSMADPTVEVEGNTVTVSNIHYGPGLSVQEKWIFTTHPDYISWRIERKYLTGMALDDTYFPGWDFAAMDTWTGALLDNGGVAWFRFLETDSATLGQHAGTVTFWNRQGNAALRVVPATASDKFTACRFSHQPSGNLTFCQSVTTQELQPKYNLSRFLANQMDVWQPFNVQAGDTASVTLQLWPLEYDKAYDRGTFKGVNESSVREIMNTMPRYGVIDRKLFGGNGWRTGYAVLHEQWWAQIALAMADPDYSQGLMDAYDYYRDYAVSEDGRVLPRFKDTPGDNVPGTYTAHGFYEVQWGYLMDSQPDYVIVVAEHFQNTGDLDWVKGQKAACERALDYLLKRDSNENGLLEMINTSHSEGKSSDWIDVIWASFENALVNAEMYEALNLWAEVEEVLQDSVRASYYLAAAEKLKISFNKPLEDGGFWNPEKGWYVYWRDKDNSVHGDNLVMPVNICAIAYGICSDSVRIASILNQMETQMQKENLFFWPLCFYSFAPGEGQSGQYPFPTYENGDIFLSWGEVAVRAYARYSPAIALKYVKNVLNRYEQDGLAFQRYLRANQQGAGDDILGGNSMAVVGLYRNIYGIRPLHNGLYLEPHLTPELNGTQIKYLLRDELYTIDLSVGDYAITVGGVTVRDSKPFAVDAQGNRLPLKALSGDN